MREIEFRGKVYSHTRYAVDAIAWATNRRGHNKWTSDDVVTTILDYLKYHNLNLVTKNFNGKEDVLVTRGAIRRAMLRLVEDNFARLKNSNNGRHIVEFEFAADVILTGHSEKLVFSEPTSKTVAKTLAEPVQHTDIELPLPEVPFQRYRAEEVNALLDEYAQKDSEAHASYVERLIEALKVILYG